MDKRCGGEAGGGEEGGCGGEGVDTRMRHVPILLGQGGPRSKARSQHRFSIIIHIELTLSGLKYV